MAEPLGRIRLDTSATVPPFEQLRTQIAALVATGGLTSGTKLPTVRQLALDLRLAPNTVARAYRELESDGILATYGRRGTFVNSAPRDEVTTTRLKEAASAYVTAARRAGLSAAEAVRLVEQDWGHPIE